MALQLSRFGRNGRLQKASENSPPLKQGENGEAVAIVQQALIDLGYVMPITTNGGRNLADGIYGAETASVVRQFQATYGLDSDGIVGRQTLAMLEQLIQALLAAERAELVADLALPSRLRRNYHRTLRGV